MGRAIARSRFVLLGASCFISVVAIIMIVAALFSVSFRTVEYPRLHGKKYFGLFRYCWEPQMTMQNGGFGGAPYSTSDTQTCYLRNFNRNSASQSHMYNGLGSNTNEFMFEFEKTTLLLLSLSVALALMAICFALCTLFSEICALAHSTVLFASMICAASGFCVYTYHNERPELLGENDQGNMLLYHYGWSYYYTGVASLLLLFSFLISLFAASVFFYNKRRNHDDSNGRIKGTTTIKL